MKISTIVTLSGMLREIAANPTPEAIARLPKLAMLAQRMEDALNQITADAMDEERANAPPPRRQRFSIISGEAP